MNMEAVEHCPSCGSSRWEPIQETGAQMHPSGDQRYTFCRCKNCDLVFLNPRVTPADLNAYYTEAYLPYRGPQAWGRFAKLVDDSQRSVDAARVEMVRAALGERTLDDQDLILDIGCGKPTFLEAFQQKLGGRCLGIDFSDSGWKGEGERYRSLDLRVGEVGALDDSLRPRAITMWHYLEHDYNPLETLQRVLGMADNETRLVIEVPNFESETRRKYGEYWAGFHTPRHLSLFSPRSMSTMLEKAGWSVVRLNNWGTLDPYVLDWMSRMERRRVDWNSSMENRFVGFVLGMMLFRLKQKLLRKRSWGVLSVVARADS